MTGFMAQPARLSPVLGGQFMTEMHLVARDQTSCHDVDDVLSWTECPSFCLARVRAICHTWFVVQDGEYMYVPIDVMDDGPVCPDHGMNCAESLRIEVHARFAHYDDALRFVTEQVITEAAENRS